MPDSATVALGPKLGKLIYADIGAGHANALRTLLRALDQLIQCSVKSRIVATPPGSPADGDAYIVASSPTGAWVGQTNKIAVWSASIANTDTNVKAPAWEFYSPRAGWLVYSEADTAFYSYSGSAWGALIAYPVTSVAGRTGAVVIAEADVTNLTTDLAAKAPNATPTFTGGITSQNVDFGPGVNLKNTTASSSMSPNLLFTDNQATPKYFFVRKVTSNLVIYDENGNPALTIGNGGAITLGSGSPLTVYQEGTWTPTLTSVTGSESCTTSGQWTRVGRLVLCQFNITVPNGVTISSASGNGKVSLPGPPAPSLGFGSSGNLQAPYTMQWVAAINVQAGTNGSFSDFTYANSTGSTRSLTGSFFYTA